MNPFRKGGYPIEDCSQLIGREKQLRKLEECILKRENTALMGVEGVGKTSLLGSYFSFSYRKKMAEEKKTLIFFSELSTQADGAELCDYLADQLTNAVRHLLRRGVRQQEREELLEELRECRDDSRNAVTRFEQAVELLHERGYFMVMVMDHFERFTSSLSITMEHHEKLRSQIEAQRMQCVVATNYDFTQDSLPPDVAGSYLIQKIQNVIQVPPLSCEEANAFITGRLEGNSLTFSGEFIDRLYRMTGGIPLFLEMACSYAYESMEENGGVVNMQRAGKKIYEAAVPVLYSWSKLLSGVQVKTLELLLSGVQAGNQLAERDFRWEEGQFQSAARTLALRGILEGKRGTDKHGRVIEYEDVYLLNSLLFQRFCLEGRMRAAAEDNPLERAKRQAQERQEKEGLSSRPSVTIHIENAQFGNGNEMRVQHNQVNQGLSVSEIVHLLGEAGDSRELFARQLSERLIQCIPEREALQIERKPGMSDAEYAERYDAEYDRISQGMVADVEVDEDAELVGITSEEQQTLERRFADARSRCRRNLSDQLLDSLGESCQFYLKLSVVVEDALGFLKLFAMQDFSPQLVLYGKALEQALRDHMFELFHKERALSVYDTYRYQDLEDSPNSFCNKTESKAYIGNFACLIDAKSGYLGKLCAEYALESEFPGQVGAGTDPEEEWAAWWKRLQADIHDAREIRNLADHAAKESPNGSKLDQMCSLLFGEDGRDGILERSRVGKALCQRVFPADLAPEVVSGMLGQDVLFRCLKVKTNGGWKGKLEGYGYEANISPRQVNLYRQRQQEELPDPKGHTFLVKVMEYKTQNDRSFFSVKPV